MFRDQLFHSFHTQYERFSGEELFNNQTHSASAVTQTDQINVCLIHLSSWREAISSLKPVERVCLVIGLAWPICGMADTRLLLVSAFVCFKFNRTVSLSFSAFVWTSSARWKLRFIPLLFLTSPLTFPTFKALRFSHHLWNPRHFTWDSENYCSVRLCSFLYSLKLSKLQKLCSSCYGGRRRERSRLHEKVTQSSPNERYWVGLLSVGLVESFIALYSRKEFLMFTCEIVQGLNNLLFLCREQTVVCGHLSLETLLFSFAKCLVLSRKTQAFEYDAIVGTLQKRWPTPAFMHKSPCILEPFMGSANCFFVSRGVILRSILREVRIRGRGGSCHSRGFVLDTLRSSTPAPRHLPTGSTSA